VSEPVLFARIGWMTYYCGPQPGDEKPQRGGKYTRTALGHEAFNFSPIRGRLYGYFQPQMQASGIQLERIEPTCSVDALNGVTVIFVATQPTAGQRIVGWYRNATVYRHRQKDTTGKRMGFDYFVSAKSQDAVLLPTRKRTQPIPGQKGGFGQANVRYLCGDGKRLRLPWANEALKYIESYKGGNLVEHPELESAAEVQDVIESHLSEAAGFESNPRIRQAIEARAMQVVEQHFRKRGFTVKDVHRTQSYDFDCISASETLCVEVKGTRSLGEMVSLTPNEVEFARVHPSNTALYVVHSIEVRGRKKPKARGGELLPINPWNPDQHDLRPMAYVCKLCLEH